MPWRYIWEWRYSSTILYLCTSWRRVVSFTPCRRTPGEGAPGTHWTGGLQTRSDRCGEEQNFGPAGNRIPALQPVAHRSTDCAIRTIKLRYTITNITSTLWNSPNLTPHQQQQQWNARPNTIVPDGSVYIGPNSLFTIILTYDPMYSDEKFTLLYEPRSIQKWIVCNIYPLKVQFR
jgi:hypothetical protein